MKMQINQTNKINLIHNNNKNQLYKFSKRMFNISKKFQSKQNKLI